MLRLDIGSVASRCRSWSVSATTCAGSSRRSTIAVATGRPGDEDLGSAAMVGGELEAATWDPSARLGSSGWWPRPAAREHRAAATVHADRAPCGHGPRRGSSGQAWRPRGGAAPEYEKRHSQSRDVEGTVAGDRRLAAAAGWSGPEERERRKRKKEVGPICWVEIKGLPSRGL